MPDDLHLTAAVYVSWGLWVADCPRPYCRGAEHYGHAPITGVVGGLTETGFRCARCGLVCPSSWPPNAEDIWFVLQQRPIMETRSWALGETLEHLVIENAAHGLMPPGIDEGVTIIDGKFNDRRILSATGSRFAIGG